jgi:protoheme ferro-lyase
MPGLTVAHSRILHRRIVAKRITTSRKQYYIVGACELRNELKRRQTESMSALASSGS